MRSTDRGNPWLIEIRTAAANGAASITTELAATFGNERVTFAAGGANPVYLDGAPDTALQIGAPQSFSAGTLTQFSANAWQLTWNTGESVIVTNQGGWLDWSVALGPNDGPGSVQGLLGSNSGQANDFQLPNGTVLPQPLSDAQILGVYADAWRVAPGASLFDDGSGPGTSFSPALFLQFMSAMGDCDRRRRRARPDRDASGRGFPFRRPPLRGDHPELVLPRWRRRLIRRLDGDGERRVAASTSSPPADIRLRSAAGRPPCPAPWR